MSQKKIYIYIAITSILPFYCLFLYIAVSSYDVYQVIPVEAIPDAKDRETMARICTVLNIEPGQVSHMISQYLIKNCNSYDEPADDVINKMCQDIITKIIKHKKKKANDDKKRTKTKGTEMVNNNGTEADNGKQDKDKSKNDCKKMEEEMYALAANKTRLHKYIAEFSENKRKYLVLNKEKDSQGFLSMYRWEELKKNTLEAANKGIAAIRANSKAEGLKKYTAEQIKDTLLKYYAGMEEISSEWRLKLETLNNSYFVLIFFFCI